MEIELLPLELVTITTTWVSDSIWVRIFL